MRDYSLLLSISISIVVDEKRDGNFINMIVNNKEVHPPSLR